MVANRLHLSNSLYMTVEQYLALDDATDGKVVEKLLRKLGN